MVDSMDSAGNPAFTNTQVTKPEQSRPKGRTVPVDELPGEVTSISLPKRSSHPMARLFPPQK